MTDHNPQLVETIARAIYDLGRYEGAFDHDLRVIDREPRVEAAIWEARQQARAALDAMPQPIGYGILVHRFAPEAAYIKGPMPLTDAVDMVTTEPEPERGETIIVALVPVEDQ